MSGINPAGKVRMKNEAKDLSATRIAAAAPSAHSPRGSCGALYFKVCAWCSSVIESDRTMCDSCREKLTDPSAPEPFDDRKGK